jgi:histidine triad (HIT) family protein
VAAGCVFCKIVARELPSTVVAENDSIMVIKDIAPKAPTHFLILPKKHIIDLRDVQQGDAMILADILLMARELSKKIDHPGSFRLLFNNGPEVGQKVFHMHAHFLAGKQLSDF